MGWLNYVVIGYGILMLFGGVMGFATAKSVPSLLSGIVAGVLLVAAGVMARDRPGLGNGIAAFVTLALIGVFIERYMKTHAARNLGLVGVSALMLLLLIAGHFMSGSKS